MPVPRSTGPRLTRDSYVLYQPDTQPHVCLSVREQRKEVEEYLAEKKYLPEVKIELANENLRHCLYRQRRR